MSIQVDSIAAEIVNMMSAYETEIKNNLDASGQAVAREGAKQLRQTSPKRTGEYAKGWGVTKVDGTFGENAKYIIHNKKHYRRTHLLENGHVSRNGKRVKGIKHIEPVEQRVIRAYEEKVREAIEDASK